MIVKVGTRVKFLNDVGGGIVTKVVSEETALVLGKDGFEIPYMLDDLLPDEQSNYTSQAKTTNQKSQETNKTLSTQPEETYYTSNPDTNVFIAFVPENQKFLTDFSYEVYLINDSNYFLNYSILIRQEDGKYKTKIGEIEPNISEPLFVLTRDEIKDDMEIQVQALFFDKRNFKIKPVIDKNLNLKPVKFYKAGSFTTNDFFDEKAMLVPVFEENAMQEAAKKISAKDIEKAMQQNTENRILNQPKQYRKRIVNKQKEVDLHLHELVDNEKGMENSDKIRLQLDTFKKELDEAIKAKLEKIIFIHGVGNGKLKHELRRELQRTYKHLKYQDASFQEYGYGATMVLLKR